LETLGGRPPALASYPVFGFVDLPPADTPYARCDGWMERKL